MGLRCSLLGHDYGESFVERDREERGNEVVVTERELRECARCGAENVTTENTEVRTLQPERSTDADTSQSSDPDPTPSEQTPPEPTEPTTDAPGEEFTSPTDAIEQAETGPVTTPDEVEGDDAVILEADADDTDPRSEQWDEPADPADADAVPEPSPDPADEDVEFVESSPSEVDDDPATQPDPEPDHQPATDAGAGTAAADAGTTSQSAGPAERARGEWPEPEGEDVGFDAGTAAETEQTAEFQFGDEDDEEEFVATDTGFTSAGPIDQSDADDLDFALFCPECGFERYAAGSSLRAGDICPECKRGYLAEER
ncbi:DUF7093 family protein [Halobacterium wangiae]|uniref:DUF7093 family protein n=1 Tax=Halobacterium wangiae TaxID=2902623 RepID=UPI001E5F22B5|nr:hypothetical protein [Halobacterium wangiae]